MRRSLLAFLLLLSFACAPQALSQTTDSQLVKESDQVRTSARKLLATGSPEDAVKAADLLDKASELDARDAATLKAKAETQKLLQPWGAESGWKVLVDLTPFLSFVIVALGFVFNSYQTRVADKEKREEAIRQQKADEEKAAREQRAAEEKRWSDAITIIQKTEDFSPAAAILSTFLTGSYAKLARETAASVMLTAKKFDNFSDLFNTFVEPVKWENLDQVLGLLRSVSITVTPLLNKAWVNDAWDFSSLTPAELDSYNLLTQERTFLGAKVAAVLRQPRPSLDPIDLSGIGLSLINLAGADLRNSIAPFTWNRVNLDGADLRGMTNVENTWVYNTAWWHAGHIDGPFLKLLIQRYPYKAGQLSNTPRGISAEDYETNVARLKAQAGEVPAL
jgi:uncharacterized protein YjbI with pentapeptide repeats